MIRRLLDHLTGRAKADAELESKLAGSQASLQSQRSAQVVTAETDRQRLHDANFEKAVAARKRAEAIAEKRQRLHLARTPQAKPSKVTRLVDRRRRA